MRSYYTMEFRERTEIIRNWQWLMLAGVIYTPLMFFISDLEYLPLRDVRACVYWRIGLTLLCALALGIRFLYTDWLYTHWRLCLRIISLSFYAFFIWFDNRSLSPDSSSYYLGMLVVCAGNLAFRIYREAVLVIAAATAAYAWANYEQTATIEAVVDLSVFTLIFLIISTNYHKVTLALMEALASQKALAETIHHDWKVPFLAMAEFAKDLRPDLRPERKKMADLIEYTSRFLYAQACELVDARERRGDHSDSTIVDLRRQFELAARTVRVVFHGTIASHGRAPKGNIMANEHEVYRIFINLLANGALHSPDRRIEVSWRTADSIIEVRFRNRIESHSMLHDFPTNRLFEKNFSLDSAGRGIGLFTTKQLVERQGGHLSVHKSTDSLEFVVSWPELQHQKSL